MTTSSSSSVRPVVDRLRPAGRGIVRFCGTATGWARPLPDFLLIGAKRGGTTALWRYLAAHPGVLPLFPSSRWLPLRADMKGVHYFDVQRHRSAWWYRGHFASSWTRRAATRARGGPVRTGEASPYYLCHPQAPTAAAGLVPHARIIVTLRDPVERAWSHWKERVREHAEHRPFEEAIDGEEALLAGAAERLAADPHFRSPEHEHHGYLTQSRYARPLETWRERFPHTFLAVQAEKLYAEPQRVVDEVTGFLGLEPVALSDPRPWNATADEQLRPEFAARLRAELADDIAAVERMLGWSTGW